MIEEGPFNKPWVFSCPGGKMQVLSWKNFHLGITPGIHPSRWPKSIPAALRERLATNPLAVEILFGLGAPPAGWVPSWYRNENDSAVSMVLSEPALLPRLHLLASAAAGRDRLAKIISSRERKEFMDFFGIEIFASASRGMERWRLPDLSPWISLPERSSVTELSRAGGSILSGALSASPITFQNQVFLCLPQCAEPRADLPMDSVFAEECRRFLHAVASQSGLIPEDSNLTIRS
jgi:hypothetical protein